MYFWVDWGVYGKGLSREGVNGFDCVVKVFVGIVIRVVEG